jgi:hypothetical protein
MSLEEKMCIYGEELSTKYGITINPETIHEDIESSKK